MSAVNDTSGHPIVNDGLWALKFGNHGPGFSPNTLYFTDGIDAERHGLFGAITPLSEPSTLALLGIGALILFVTSAVYFGLSRLKVARRHARTRSGAAVARRQPLG